MIVPLFGGRPVFVMILSQSLAIISTPVILILMIILLNRKEIMSRYRATWKENIIYGITFLFTVIVSIVVIVEIIQS
ncbi:MAG: hypothetical protein LUD15_14225 [Bacteroides sp.]|nr:hypothetical protein [Bacteroides sp.]